MSATSRRAGPAGAHTEAIVVWTVLLVVLLAGGLLTASLHLAVRLSGSGEQLPAHPVTLLSDLVRGRVEWPRYGTLVLVALTAAVAGAALLAAWLWRRRGRGRGRPPPP